ncbi:MAG: UDP-N-acetylmuramoylalanyl-D-glutamate--2,6-diaminopimelate ligase [Actinomycetota bacterium]
MPDQVTDMARTEYRARSRTLAELLADVRGGPALDVITSPEAVVDDITVDSRAVTAGSVFCCVRGERFDGHDFVRDAVAAGATALVVEHDLGFDVPSGVGVVRAANVRAAVGWLAAALFDHPSDDLLVVGVTGTNGKTTTAHLIGEILRADGRPTAVFGTLSGTHTTPEAPVLQRRLAQCRADGIRAVVTEVSSHALVLDRVNGTRFDIAVFTNLGRDHLDLHGTVERYFAAKALLFEPTLCDRAVVNVDDVHGRLLADTVRVSVDRFSLDDASEVVVGPTRHEYLWRGRRIEVGIGGAFNVMNSLAAATVGHAAGVPDETIARALASARPVPGRFEPVLSGQDFAVVVDYAHTPDGLVQALRAARASATDGRVLVVFGCGGDRDRDKRPEMGSVAAELADMVVVTSDNPRSEDPLDIIGAIEAGVSEEYRHKIVTEPDRRMAIAAALDAARPGDIVVIAGKGHETTQTTGQTVVEFDDRAVASSLLEERT